MEDIVEIKSDLLSGPEPKEERRAAKWVVAQLYLPCQRCDNERPFVPREYHLSSSPQALVTECDLGHTVLITETLITAEDLAAIRASLLQPATETSAA